ncbi:hypothetical protein QUA56_10560 [Microcoleus sp. N3A4]
MSNNQDTLAIVQPALTFNCQLSGASLIDGRFLFGMVGSDAPYNCQLSGASLIDGRFLFGMVGSDAPYNCQLSTVNCQLSTANCQLSTANCQLSTVNSPPEISPIANCYRLHKAAETLKN